MSEDNVKSVGWKFHTAEQEILNILLNCNLDIGDQLDRTVVENEFSMFKDRERECEEALMELARKGYITLDDEALWLTEIGHRHVFGPAVG